MFIEEDEINLRLASEVRKIRPAKYLISGIGFVGGNEHLLHYFTKNGWPITNVSQL